MQQKLSPKETQKLLMEVEGVKIVDANHTYGYVLLFYSECFVILIEAAWKLYKCDQLFLDITREEYDQIQPKIEELKGLIVSRFDLQESEPSIKLIFSNQYDLEVFPPTQRTYENSYLAIKRLSQKTWTALHRDKQFYRNKNGAPVEK